MPSDPAALSLGELVATLSLAQDSAFGQPLESELRTCLLSVWLAERLGLDAATCDDIWFTALLRYIGCSGHAHEASRLFGDEIAARARTLLYDASAPAEVLLEMVRHAGEGRPLPQRLAVLASVLAGGKKAAEANFRTGCEVAVMLAERLSLPPGVRAALVHAFERWNGKGFPDGVAKERIALPMRVVHLTQEMEALARVAGVDAAVALAKKRSGRAYDPAVAEAYVRSARELHARLDACSPWDDALALSPRSGALEGDALDAGLEVAADFVDLKSPFTGGHSRAVGALARRAAAIAGLPEARGRALLRAGLVHDLGHTGVPNTIWDKPAALTRAELDRVRLHTLLTDRMLARTPGLDTLRELATSHHERLDGSGYHRGLKAPEPKMDGRLLAASDVYVALREPRAHRPARPDTEAASELRAGVRQGTLDRDAVEAVLAAAGHRADARPARFPHGLTAREVEVLVHLARGLTTKEIGVALGIATKTTDHHIQSVYQKIGVTTRGAAALFAAQNGLV